MGSFNNDDTSPPVPQIVETVYGLYPGQNDFSDEYDAQDYCDWVEQSNGDPLPAPLAVYIRDSDPLRQARNAPGKTVDSGAARAIRQELRLQGALFDSDRPVQQLICTGNIAAGWTDDQLYGLVSAVRDSFTMGEDVTGWCACLGNTRIPEARLRLLQVLGFVNIRFAVPQHNASDTAQRHGLLDDIEDITRLARGFGMRHVMVDLSFSETAAPLAPGKLEAFVNGTRPELIRLVEEGPQAPTGKRPLQRDVYAELLTMLGYENIGLDWFVRPGDLWCRPRSSRQLHWSVLGFTDMPSPDVIGVGPGAVSTLGDFYGQNEHRLNAYDGLVNEGLIPTVRGIELESDDKLRREIMVMMLTGSRIDFRAVENKWGIQFDQFFSREIKQLYRFQEAGWVEIGADSVAVIRRGRRELRQLCEIFDHRIRMIASENAPSFA